MVEGTTLHGPGLKEEPEDEMVRASKRRMTVLDEVEERACSFAWI